MSHGGIFLPRQMYKFQNSFPQICYFESKIHIELGVQNRELEMLRCMNPCVRSRLTHQLLEKMNFIIPSCSAKYPLHNKAILIKLCLELQSIPVNPVRTVSEFLVEQPVFNGKERFFFLNRGFIVNHSNVIRCCPQQLDNLFSMPYPYSPWYRPSFCWKLLYISRLSERAFFIHI